MRITRVAFLVAFGLLILASNQSIPLSLAGASARQQLIGAWRLVSNEETVNGKLTKRDQTGILTYTSDGHMSVQIVDKNPNASHSGNPVQYSANGTKATSAPLTSTKPHTLLPITSKVPWCAR